MTDFKNTYFLFVALLCSVLSLCVYGTEIDNISLKTQPDKLSADWSVDNKKVILRPFDRRVTRQLRLRLPVL